MDTSPSLIGEKKRWWFRGRKVASRYIGEARQLMATQDPSDLELAISLLDSVLAAFPRHELALELRVRCLLQDCRYKDVADMLQDYIPSLRSSIGPRNGSDESGSVSSDSSSQKLTRGRGKLLPQSSSSVEVDERDSRFKCFSVRGLKKKVMTGLLCKSSEEEGQWRYTVLGQACFHLGLIDEAMVLLQTGKRLASAASRRRSICCSDDSFSLSALPFPISPPRRSTTEAESISNLLAHVKLLVHRRTAAVAALNAGLHSEAIRHFTKVVEGRHTVPQAFLAECYLGRAAAYRANRRVAEAIADCNKTLALDPTCLQALETRAALLESICCLPDSLHDLEYLKLLYSSILRDRMPHSPPWKRETVQYREIPGRLCALTVKMQELKKRVASGEAGRCLVDYYALMGLQRGCSRSELQRAHLLLILRHKPDKALGFIERCEFVDDQNLDSVKDRANMSAMLLYRLIQKGYASIMANITAAERAAPENMEWKKPTSRGPEGGSAVHGRSSSSSSNSNYQGVYCRDLAVGNLLAQAGFNLPLRVTVGGA